MSLGLRPHDEYLRRTVRSNLVRGGRFYNRAVAPFYLIIYAEGDQTADNGHTESAR